MRCPTCFLSQAGARVQQVVDALAPHGLTLQNYASISEQQLGGFLQVRIVPHLAYASCVVFRFVLALYPLGPMLTKYWSAHSRLVDWR